MKHFLFALALLLLYLITFSTTIEAQKQQPTEKDLGVSIYPGLILDELLTNAGIDFYEGRLGSYAMPWKEKYPEARLVYAAYCTKDPVEKVVTFYERQLRKKAWHGLKGFYAIVLDPADYDPERATIADIIKHGIEIVEFSDRAEMAAEQLKDKELIQYMTSEQVQELKRERECITVVKILRLITE